MSPPNLISPARVLALSLAALGLAQPTVHAAATTGFNQTAAGPWDYNAPGNWITSNINGVWDPALTLAANQTVTLAVDTTLASGLSFNHAGNKTLALTAAAAGTVNLTLGGDVAVNTTGGTLANVTLGNTTNHLNLNLGGIPRTMTVAASRTLTIVDVISNGSIIKTGTGTLTISGTNTFEGGLNIQQGTVTATTSTSALGGSGSGTVTLGGIAGQDAKLMGNTASYTLNNPITLSSTGGTLTIGNSANGTLTYAGIVSGSHDLVTSNNNNGTMTFTNIAITGGVTNSGTGAGGVVITTLGSNVGSLTETSTSALTITNSVTTSGNLLLTNNGTSAITLTGGANNSGSITNTGTGTGGTTITGAIGSNVTSVTQNNPNSTLKLSGANTFTGGLYVKAGTVADNGALGNFGPVGSTIYLGDNTVGLNATLQTGSNGVMANNPINVVAGAGTRTIKQLDGTNSNGNLPGAITLNNDLNLQDFSSYTKCLTLSGSISGNGSIAFNTPTGGGSYVTLSGTSINNAGTITNTSASTGASTIIGAIGTNVTGVIQNSSTSTLILSGTNTYTSATTITQGTLQLGNAGISGSLNPLSVISNSGTLKFNRTNTLTQGNDFNGILSGTGQVIQAGTGTLVLNGSNTYTGQTSIQAGALSINSINNVGSASSSMGAPATVSNGTINIGSTTIAGKLIYTGSGDQSDRVINLAGTTGGATLDQSGSGLVKFTSNMTVTGNGSKMLTLQGSTTGSGEVAGSISDYDTATSTITALTKTGTGRWTLSGSNTYTGATTVSGGVLIVSGTLNAASAVNVTGGTLGGTGMIGGTVTLSGTGGLDLTDNAVATMTLGGNLNVTGAAGANNIYFDLGANGTDQIIVTGTMTTSGAVVIHFNQLGAAGTTLAPGIYHLIQAATMAPVGNFTLAADKPYHKSYALGVTGGTLQLTVTDDPAGPVETNWSGAADANWSNLSNWNTNASEGIIAAGLPSYQTNVIFPTTTPAAATLTTLLNLDLWINSLTFSTAATSNITIGGTKTLTLEGGTSNGHTAGDGITVNTPNSGTPNHTISANISLAASQTWTVNNGAALSVSGTITDSNNGYALTKTGAGTLTLAGSNSFSGGLTINAGTLVIAADAGLGAPTGALVLNGGTLQTTTSFSLAAGRAITLDRAGGTLDTLAATTLTVSQHIDGPGGLTKTSPGTLTLSGHHSYGGATIVTQGTLRLTGSGTTLGTALGKIMPMGDSITYGSGGSNAGYRGPLYNLLNTASYDFQFVGSANNNPGKLPTSPVDQTHHNGFSGWRISQSLNGVTPVDQGGLGWLSVNPDIITLMIGTNNRSGGVAGVPASIIELEQLIDTVSQTAPAAQLFVAEIIPIPALPDFVTAFNASLVTMVNRKQGAGAKVSVVDLNTNFPANSLGDGLHPNDTGYNWMAQQWYNAIAATYNCSGSEVLPPTTAVSLASGATLDCHGVNQTIASLSGSGAIINSATTLPLTLTINPAAGSTTFSGSISDNGSTNAISLVKSGTGTQVLAGATNYSGNTTVNAGTLSINNAILTDSSTLSITTGAVLNLNFTGTDTIDQLLIDGVRQAAGSWGAIDSTTATHTTPLITGSGLLNVTTGPTFESWINGYASLTTANRALLADPDGDGLNNLLEYALGGNPTLASPAVAPKSNNTSGNLALTCTRTTTTTDLTLTVQSADSLSGTWTNLASSVGGAAMAALLDGVVVIETGSGTTRSVEVRDLYPIANPGHPQRFMRLQVQTK